MNEMVTFYEGEVVHLEGYTLEKSLSADNYWPVVASSTEGYHGAAGGGRTSRW